MTPWQKEHERYLAKKRERSEKKESEKQEKFNESLDTDKHTSDDRQEVEELLAEEDSFEELERTSERVSFMDKLPRLHSYHHKRMVKRIILIIGILLVPLLISGYYVSPLSKLQKVTVVGNEKVASTDIIKASSFKMNEDFFHQYYKRQTAIKNIKEKNPRIKSVKVSMLRLNSLKVTVKEYSEIAQLEKDKKYYSILESGKVLTDSHKDSIAGLITLENFKDEHKILETITSLSKLPQAIQSSISQISYAPTNSSEDLLNLFMNDGNKVIVSASNLLKQMPYYPQVAKDLKAPGIVDMQVGIFYSPYPSSETGTADSSNTNETQSSAETVSEQTSSSSQNN